jgi:hypothetical protein
MDERALSLIFLLMALVLPLRSLSEGWAARPERRNALRALWALYGLVAVGAFAALIVTGRERTRPSSPPAEGSEQFALREAAGSGISAG